VLYRLAVATHDYVLCRLITMHSGMRTATRLITHKRLSNRWQACHNRWTFSHSALGRPVVWLSLPILAIWENRFPGSKK